MKDCDTSDENGLCPIEPPTSNANSGASEKIIAPPPKLDAPLPASYNAYFIDGNLPASLEGQDLGPLTHKLLSFLRRPALSHGEAFEANNAACPPALADALVNPDQLRDNRAFWEGVDNEEIVRRRAELVLYLADKVGEGVVGVAGEVKRGIVMTAGNKVSLVGRVS